MERPIAPIPILGGHQVKSLITHYTDYSLHGPFFPIRHTAFFPSVTPQFFLSISLTVCACRAPGSREGYRRGSRRWHWRRCAAGRGERAQFDLSRRFSLTRPHFSHMSETILPISHL